LLIQVRGKRSDRVAAWNLVSDTDWLNRVGKNSAVGQMEFRPDGEGYPRIVGELIGPLGIRMAFEEDKSAWIRGRFFEQRRSFQSGVFRTTAFSAKLHPDEDGVIPEIQVDITPAQAFLGPVVRAAASAVQRRWQAAVEALPLPGQGEGPPEIRSLDAGAMGVLRRWQQSVAPELADRIHRHLLTERPVLLQRTRAFQLADRWGLDRDEVLNGLIRGVKPGLFELYWSVRCPRCYGQTSSTHHLGDVQDHAACASCQLQFLPDLGENVEVLFAPHPGITPRAQENFCTVFPAAAEETHASFLLAPGEQAQGMVALTPGRWRLGDGADLHIEVTQEPGSGELSWRRGTEGETVQPMGEAALQMHNDGAERTRVQLFLDSESPQLCPASYLTNLPEFRRRMSHQVLARDIRISVRSTCLLFTDLAGSTAMYEELGDAAAYAVVRDHFSVLRKVVEAEGGVVVKTIGDAVMAAFNHEDAAMRAGVEAVRTIDRFIAERQLTVQPRLRAGVHVGPALMVHSDTSGLDYFGRTVNIAARTEGAARPGELCWTQDVHDRPEVALAIQGLPGRVSEERSTFKGILGEQVVYRLVVQP
jgi:adenylate cyclase